MSLRAIAVDWNKQGIKTTRGNTWSKGTVKQILRNPRICGFRSRKVQEFTPETGGESIRVEPVLDDDGKPVKGQWEPIISVTDWEAVTAVIGSRPEPGGAHNARKYLGTGILRCDKNGCGGHLRAMKASPSRKKPEGFFDYTCPDKGTGYGCGGVRISGPETDKALKMLVITKYEDEAQEREATAAAPQDWDGEGQLARIREDIEDWTERRDQRLVSKERFFAFLAKAEATERRLINERNEWRRRTLRAKGKPIDLRSVWDDLDFVEQRAYVEKTLLTVLVSPAGRPRIPVWGRLTPVYRDED
ncbi:recombinase family protein [Streptomyces sp. NPDC127038]|uniref:recombinase family protein n=1 Tax=Streptomyces sp. NPDC127038 TaxID=3347114 RepID=UPI0036645656